MLFLECTCEKLPIKAYDTFSIPVTAVTILSWRVPGDGLQQFALASPTPSQKSKGPRHKSHNDTLHTGTEFPTRGTCGAIIMLLLRHNVATSIWRNNDVIITLCVRWVVFFKLAPGLSMHSCIWSFFKIKINISYKIGTTSLPLRFLRYQLCLAILFKFTPTPGAHPYAGDWHIRSGPF